MPDQHGQPVNARPSGLHAFAFQTGRWTVRHHKRRERLAGCDEWYSFDGTCEARELLGGAGNVDDHWIGDPVEPYGAASIRRLHSDGEWSILWIDSRRADLDPPMRGAFDGSAGTFYGKDELRSKPIDVRFIWSRTDQLHPRWEQAFSDDRGQSWETNWIMDFTRDDEVR